MSDSIFFELESEKKKILKMVEEKKITAEEADRLISILEESVLKEEAKEKLKEEMREAKDEDKSSNQLGLKREKIPNVKGKIVVHVFENGVKKVNVVLPIALAKLADKLPIQSNISGQFDGQNQISIKDLFKTAKENGLNIEQGMYILVKDDEVHIYDADGLEFVNVTEIKK
jgi:hypothetical protein